jgi:hypothetical protein
MRFHDRLAIDVHRTSRLQDLELVLQPPVGGSRRGDRDSETGSRRPVVAGIECDAAGIHRQRRGVRKSESLRENVSASRFLNAAPQVDLPGSA